MSVHAKYDVMFAEYENQRKFLTKPVEISPKSMKFLNFGFYPGADWGHTFNRQLNNRS